MLPLGRPVEGRAPRLMRLYRLPAAETDVALAIARGETVRALAERRGVRIPNLRSQVAAILSKTATERQAELVALVLRVIG